jgi:hypothetical protein
METLTVPEWLLFPMRMFAGETERLIHVGIETLGKSKVAFVGLARDCGRALRSNLTNLKNFGSGCREWCLHIEENDSTDDTVQVLRDFCAEHRQATFTSRKLGRERYGNEFAGRRTIRLGEYRTACQQWVRDCAPDADFVVMVDWDQCGWSQHGVIHGFGCMTEMQDAYGMASVSLLEAKVAESDGKEIILKRGWLHYDTWTLRINTWWDDYTAGQGAWKHQWLPPVGSPPAHVLTAFGGLAIYRTADWLQGTYDGREDCEHVVLHRTMQERTGKRLYLNPTQRCVMQFLPPDDEATDGGKHGND